MQGRNKGNILYVECDVLTEMNVKIMATWRILLQATYTYDGVNMFLLSAGT